MPEPCDSLTALADAFDERAAVVSDIGRACYQAAATMARERAREAAGAASQPAEVSADGGRRSRALRDARAMRAGYDTEAWLKRRRDAYPLHGPGWQALDDAVDDWRLHSDTGVALQYDVPDGEGWTS